MNPEGTTTHNGNQRHYAGQYRGRGDTSGRRGHRPPALETSEGRAAYDAISAAKARQQSRRWKVTLVFMGCLVAAATALLVATRGESAFISLVCVFSCLFVAVVGITRVTWSEHDYYSVPGSRDERGEHRCIHCGNRGLYRHGKYKSHQKLADCSKCKTNLWVYRE